VKYYKDQDEPPHFAKRWTLRKVVKYERKEDINNKISAEKGSKEYLRQYNSAVTSVVNSLTEEETDNYLALAEKWTEARPPQELQQM
jgi:hypothetical protein